MTSPDPRWIWRAAIRSSAQKQAARHMGSAFKPEKPTPTPTGLVFDRMKVCDMGIRRESEPLDGRWARRLSTGITNRILHRSLHHLRSSLPQLQVPKPGTSANKTRMLDIGYALVGCSLRRLFNIRGYFHQPLLRRTSLHFWKSFIHCALA